MKNHNRAPLEWPNSWKHSHPKTADWLKQAHWTTLAGSRWHHLDRDKLLGEASPPPDLTIPKNYRPDEPTEAERKRPMGSLPKLAAKTFTVQTVDSSETG
jgi:hypothetical protein